MDNDCDRDLLQVAIPRCRSNLQVGVSMSSSGIPNINRLPHNLPFTL